MNRSEVLLRQLEGETLSSVEFVSDYFQLRFNGPTITILLASKIQVDSKTWKQSNEEDYCVYLIKLINQVVEEVRFEENDFFQIRFQNGFLFYMSMKPEDYIFGSPEGLLFWGNNNVWDVW